MKKIISIIAIMLVCSLSLAACTSTVALDMSKNISVTAREDGSGTKTAFMELVGLKGKADPTGTIISGGTAAVLTEVKGNVNAIGYESLGYVTAGVKMLSVDGVLCTVENIKAGTYKISRPLSVVYKETTIDNATNKAFYEFLQSNAAKTIISDEGYVSIVENASEYTIDGSLSGTIGVSGSTSLQPLMIKLAGEFKKLQPNITIDVAGGGSGTGYGNAENGTSDFGMISEVFNSSKAASCVSSIVAIDGIAVIVNTKNTFNDITSEQLKAIYDAEAGLVKTWADVK